MQIYILKFVLSGLKMSASRRGSWNNTNVKTPLFTSNANITQEWQLIVELCTTQIDISLFSLLI
jgi:hypothetical protein